jgi:hypothetical protein
VIKIRLWGTREELAEALPILRDSYNVLSVSQLHRDRGESEYYRLYVEAEIKSPPDLNSLASRTHRDRKQRN